VERRTPSFRDIGLEIIGADAMLAPTVLMTDPAVVNVAPR
jgi:hypothetical protein